MNDHFESSSSAKSGCGVAALIIGASLIGFIGFVFASDWLISTIFGVDRHDSSAVWGLAGAGTLIVSILCSPAYFIAYGVGHLVFFRRMHDHGVAALYSLLCSIPLGAVISCIVWLSLGGGRVLKAT
jgi:hypothetical protein